MRNAIYLILALLILGCEKENGLTSQIELENLYEIKDDPSDPIKHRVYEIYDRYGVPVYFNDTIGKIFVKRDVTCLLYTSPEHGFIGIRDKVRKHGIQVNIGIGMKREGERFKDIFQCPSGNRPVKGENHRGCKKNQYPEITPGCFGFQSVEGSESVSSGIAS